MEREAEVYGKRTISGFLAQVGAEEASSSDRVLWSEQGRLHLAYTATYNDNNTDYTIVTILTETLLVLIMVLELVIWFLCL